MNNLPLEILHKILIQLPIIQKQECMLVCCYWKECVITHNMLTNIECKNTDSCNQFLCMIEKTPSLGTQVKYLELHGHFHHSYNKAHLLSYFPNLREIKFGNDDLSDTYVLNLLCKGFQTEALPVRIKSLSDTSRNCKMIRSLIETRVYYNLVTLNLSLLGRFNFDIDCVCSLLKNLPELKHLQLESIYLTIYYCEVIHANAPKLVSLELSPIEYFERDTIPIPIKPSTSITKLNLFMRHFALENQEKWFAYISKKYPQLADFYFKVLGGYNDDHLDYFYDAAFPMMIQSLDPCLTWLKLSNIAADKALFSALDNAGCKLHYLELVQATKDIIAALIGSNQSKYIAILEITVEFPWYFKWLKSMTNLSILAFRYWRRISNTNSNERRTLVKASTFFQSFPSTVTQVKIILPSIDFKMGKIQEFPITTLVLDCIETGRRLDTFISNCLPYLENLTIHKAFQQNEILNIPDHDFYYLNVFNNPVSNNPGSKIREYNMVFTAINENIGHYYNITDIGAGFHLSKFENYIIPTLHERELNSENVLTVVCSSVEHLHFGRYTALKNNKNELITL